MSTLARIRTYPIKALDPLDLETARITDVGGLEYDRRYAIVDDDGEYVNGKRTAAAHRLRSEYDPETELLTLRIQDRDEPHQFHLQRDRSALEAWLSDYFDLSVQLEERTGGAQTDSGTGWGPTIISTATLETVADWHDIDLEETRRRFRPNLEVEGVEAFWEDRLFAGEDEAVRFRIGDVEFEGRGPVPRCVVPTRNSYTGETDEGFQSTFVERREATIPDWVDRSQFDHFFMLMTLTRIPEAERGKRLAVGDRIERLEIVDAPV
ncbi:MAG: MOSC N-terminal beta barrel domain-containing protein [Halobacteriales archaeon]|nr:MOSC N-terminal beta barrel domain-containing protein [Halobacteriales archaeon]